MAVLLSKTVTKDGETYECTIEDYELVKHGVAPQGTTHASVSIRQSDSNNKVAHYEGEPADIDIILE